MKFKQLSFEDLIKKEEEAISYSKLNTARFCAYAYYLQYVEKIDRADMPMLGYTVKGFFVHNRIRNLFKPDKSLKFKSAEKFANAARGWWKKHICLEGGKWHKREVVWNYPNQWWSFGDDVWNACYNYYRRLEEEGYTRILQEEGSSPIVYMEKNFPFEVNGRKFVVSFDEIRRPMEIRELKVKKEPKNLDEKLEEDLQLTFQALGFCSVAHTRKPFRIQCGVSDDLADSLGGNPYFISPEVSAKLHYLVEDKEGGGLHATQRNDEDFYNLMKEVDSLDEIILRQNFLPNHKACKACQFNVFDKNGRVVCEEKKPGVETPNVYIYS